MAVRDRISRILRRDTTGTPAAHPAAHVASPWWARLFVRGGQPLAVVVVMLMCAPGEHHLAKLAGWESQLFGIDLAWGMAALLAGYAGMAAYLAGERPKGAPGHRTAVWGAGVALALAMAAQPISHAFVTGWLTAEPRTPLWLVIAVSCVPAPVLGHILHLAATQQRPARRAATEQPEQHQAPATEQPETEPEQTEPVHEQSETPTDQPETELEQRSMDDLLTEARQRFAVDLRTGVIPSAITLISRMDLSVEQAHALNRELVRLCVHDPEQLPRFLTTREVADRYGVTMSAVGNWRQRGKISPALVDPSLGNLYDPEHLPPLANAAG